MNKEDLEKYFRVQCKQCCFIERQKRKIAEKVRNLTKKIPDAQLEMVESLLELKLSQEMKDYYLSPNFSKEDLKKQKEELTHEIQSYEDKIKKLNEEYCFWRKRHEIIFQEIMYTVIEANECNIRLHVEEEEQAIALIKYFTTKEGYAYDVVDLDNVDISKMKGIMYEFYKAYILADLDKMMELSDKYVG